MRDTGAKEIIELRSKKLELSDWVAAKVHKWAITIATIEGAATGAGGIITLPVDIPFLITFSLKTIHKIGLCYGYDCDTNEERDFVFGILSLSGANTEEERVNSLSIQVAVAKQLATEALMKNLQRQIGRESACFRGRSLLLDI